MLRIITVCYIILLSVNAKITIFLTDGPIQRIGPRIYKQELLTNEFLDPKELAYDSATRNLFFMYMDNELQNSGRGVINVITKKSKKINGIARNKATAVDPETGDVYFGSDNGLYLYDPLTNSATNIGLYNVNVFKLVIRNNEMYLIDANNHMIYRAYNQGSRLVKFGNAITVMDFEVDNSRNVHFVTMCGVYCALGGRDIVKNKDLNVVYNFIVDEDKTYGITEGGLYDIDCANGTAVRIAELDFAPRSIIYGDYGDIFYSVFDNIYRLRPITSYLIYNLPRRPKHNLP